MARIYLVRHGEASDYEGPDPGLSERGALQARLVADRFDTIVDAPIELVASPLRRARETADPLAARWSSAVLVVDEVRELPSPGALTERRAWLRAALHSTFADLGEQQREWRSGILQFLSHLARDTAVFTHAVVINAVVGHLQNDDRVLAFVPANTSITVVDVVGGQLTLVERGAARDDAEDLG
jgi:broad specificity phosphatase PhoE